MLIKTNDLPLVIPRDDFQLLWALASIGAGLYSEMLTIDMATVLLEQGDITADMINTVLDKAGNLLNAPQITEDEADLYIRNLRTLSE